MFYLLFWLSLVLLALGTFVYPLLLWAIARNKKQAETAVPAELPRMSVVLTCGNEEELIARKINNLLELDYPQESLEVVVVLAGSADRSEVIVDLLLPHPCLQVVTLPQATTLAQAWNAGAAAATGQVLVFTDTRQLLQPDALRALAAGFADPAVGAVTGARASLAAAAGSPMENRRIKLKVLIRRLRYAVKRWESRIHSVTEVNEALFACRRENLQVLPEAFVLPGLAVLLEQVKQGYRVVFEPRALVYDTARYPLRREIERYRRMFFGYYQHLFSGESGQRGSGRPIWWQLALHNWIRLAFPFLFVLLFVSNLFIAKDWFYNSLLLAELLLAGVGLLSIVFHKPLLFYLASRFNVLALQSLYDFLTRKR
ncbi:MAG: glycosyltransferase [Adhaeribacter sp.]